MNVLANFMHKPYENLFHEFEGVEYEEEYLLGDVKYHLGYTTTRNAGDKDVKLTLSPNPSHLEAVDPVVEGIARAREEGRSEIERETRKEKVSFGFVFSCFEFQSIK